MCTISNHTFSQSAYFPTISLLLIICGVPSYFAMPSCNQVLHLVTMFLYTTQFAHAQVVTVLKARTHSLIAFIVSDLFYLITIASNNHCIIVYAVNDNPRRTCSSNVAIPIQLIKVHSAQISINIILYNA